MKKEKILTVQDLFVNFETPQGKIYAVNGVSFDVYKGQTLALVGESGCGKSVTSLSLVGLLKRNATVKAKKVEFKNQELFSLSKEEWRRIRGVEISMIFQNSLSVLNPALKVECQIGEMFSTHFPKMRKKEIYEKSIEMLYQVGISEPKLRMRSYPHELSGGLRQRVMIAIALSAKASLLIADEPTTALDVTIQAQILQLLKKLQKENGTGMLLITHDFRVVSQMADQVAVMYAGYIVERGSAQEVLKRPLHPYTQCLIHSSVDMDSKRGSRLAMIGGSVPELSHQPKGCVFAPRCPKASLKCYELPPKAWEKNGHYVYCHLEGKYEE